MINYKQTQLFAIIKQEVDKIDIYSLLEGGCPKDEFDEESCMIYSRLKKGMTTENIAKVICDVFKNMFKDDFLVNGFVESAKVIEKELNKTSKN